jgi:ABC-2 type transport system ATP-binding protein
VIEDFDRLTVTSLSRHYGRRKALSRVTFSCSSGDIAGLLGPNGAGKSTLMRILATITKPTEGHVRWDGTDVVKHPESLRPTLGYLPQDFGIYPQLNPVEFLEYLAAVKGLDPASAKKRIHDLLDLVNLTDARKRPLGGFSGGMRQRVGIAQALLNDPGLLIVDEPTAGLDPEERVRFRDLLRELAGERVVLLSTHIVSDVEAIAAFIAIVYRGRLLVNAAPEAVIAQAPLDMAQPRAPHTLEDAYLRWIAAGRHAEAVVQVAGA